MNTDAFFDRHRSITYRYLAPYNMLRVTLPKSKKARMRAYTQCARGWLEIPLSEALDIIARSRFYTYDDRHPIVRKYVDLWESVRSGNKPDSPLTATPLATY